MGHSVLHRPRFIALYFHSARDCDCKILMPAHRPVLACGLVEQNEAHRLQPAADERTQFLGMSQRAEQA